MTTKDYKFKDMGYLLSLPDDFSPEKKYPMILFLHGAGTRGRNVADLRGNLFFLEMEKHALPCVIFAPQCYGDSWFDLFTLLLEFFDFARGHAFVDGTRVSVVGNSMGGYATWQIAMSRCDDIAAAIPVCGGGMYWNAPRLKSVKIRAFHGTEDDVVLPEESVHMVDAARAHGADATLTLFEGVGHASWVPVFADKALFSWLIEQTKEKASEPLPTLLGSKTYG